MYYGLRVSHKTIILSVIYCHTTLHFNKYYSIPCKYSMYDIMIDSVSASAPLKPKLLLLAGNGYSG